MSVFARTGLSSPSLGDLTGLRALKLFEDMASFESTFGRHDGALGFNRLFFCTEFSMMVDRSIRNFLTIVIDVVSADSLAYSMRCCGSITCLSSPALRSASKERIPKII
jgi:hypothetical protein